jgi:hypothetical protein
MFAKYLPTTLTKSDKIGKRKPPKITILNHCNISINISQFRCHGIEARKQLKVMHDVNLASVITSEHHHK